MKRFNVRVYGLFFEQNKVLVCEEEVKGIKIIKFPGGGLEFGEGTLECIKREWAEELNVDIEVLSHFYTTDYFQPSAWDDSQIISVYYTIRPLNTLILPYQNGREHFYWLVIDDELLDLISLPIDKLVVRKLLGLI